MTGKSHGYTVPKVCLTSNNACITASTTPKGHTVIQIIIILQCNCLSRFYWGKLESASLKTLTTKNFTVIKVILTLTRDFLTRTENGVKKSYSNEMYNTCTYVILNIS